MIIEGVASSVMVKGSIERVSSTSTIHHGWWLIPLSLQQKQQEEEEDLEIGAMQ